MLDFETILIKDLLNPATFPGAIFYAVLFFILALIASTIVKRIIFRLIDPDHKPSADRTAVIFLSQFARAASFLIAVIMYLHLVPGLRSLGTAILTTASVGSIVLGLAAQNTLGNIIVRYHFNYLPAIKDW